MADVNAILNQRIKKTETSSKMAAMAKQSATGNLTSFSGVFSVSELSDKDKQSIEMILRSHAGEYDDVESDLHALISITSEVKAINNQAALLHGERIKKAHQILIRYRDGAFTAWLMTAYGNRQTPYNLMQYYEFYEAMPKPLRPQIESMPRQAIYALASRQGSLEEKQKIIENYRGETKIEVLSLIRQVFPLSRTDRRRSQVEENCVQVLHKLCKQLQEASSLNWSSRQQKTAMKLIKQLQEFVMGKNNG